ncbi:hypothetical protein CCR95_08985 [Thiocystis minor]|nr:hypothetical protein [Thiocystis minor]
MLAANRHHDSPTSTDLVDHPLALPDRVISGPQTGLLHWRRPNRVTLSNLLHYPTARRRMRSTLMACHRRAGGSAAGGAPNGHVDPA